MKLNHIAFSVHDVEAAITHFSTLGFEVEGRGKHYSNGVPTAFTAFPMFVESLPTNMASYASRNRQRISSGADNRAQARVGEELGKRCISHSETNMFLELVQVSGQPAPGLLHLAFQVADLQIKCAELLEAGYEYEAAPFFNERNQTHMAFLRHPAGFIAQLNQLKSDENTTT